MNDEDNNLNETNNYIPKHAYNNEINNFDRNNAYTNNDFYKVKNDVVLDENIYSDFDDNRDENIKVKSVKKKRKLKRKVLTLLTLFFVIILIFCSIKILLWMKDNKDTSSVTNEIINAVNIEEREDDDNTELVNEDDDKKSDYWYYITFPLINVDFTELKGKNSDTVGWINVNNTNINYPYVQTTDNSFYLNHSFDKSYNEAGWVFLDYRNNNNLDNKNTILYAHSRLDKTMFGSLSKVLKSSWYNNKDNHIIRLSTESENTLWQIFSVYKIPEESYYITTEFNNDSDYEEFLNVIKNRSIYNFNTTLNNNDKVLTLSTCYSDTERTVVHAKLIKKSSK